MVFQIHCRIQLDPPKISLQKFDYSLERRRSPADEAPRAWRRSSTAGWDQTSLTGGIHRWPTHEEVRNFRKRFNWTPQTRSLARRRREEPKEEVKSSLLFPKTTNEAAEDATLTPDHCAIIGRHLARVRLCLLVGVSEARCHS